MAQYFYSTSLSLLNVLSDPSKLEVTEKVKELGQVHSYVTDMKAILFSIATLGAWQMAKDVSRVGTFLGSLEMLQNYGSSGMHFSSIWWLTPSLALRSSAVPTASVC